MSSSDERQGRSQWFRQLANSAGHIISRTAASAHEVLNDADLRKRTGGKVLRSIQGGIQGGIQGISNTVQGVGGSILKGRQNVQNVLEKLQARSQQQRLQRALLDTRNKPVDVHIGYNLYEDVPQETRSRFWFVLLADPTLAHPLRELGRFPDTGSFSPETVATSPSEAPIHSPSPSHTPSAAAGPNWQFETETARAAGSAAQTGTREETEEGAGSANGSGMRSSGDKRDSPPTRSSEEHVPDISDVMSDEPLRQSDMAGSHRHIVKGGEVADEGEDDVEGGGQDEDSWEVVHKVDSHAATYVGPASLARAAQPFCRPQPSMATTAEAAEEAAASESNGEGSIRCGSVQGRMLRDAERLRLEAQEATALKLKVTMDRIIDAMIAVPWPVKELKTTSNGRRYSTFLQVTLGQEDVEEIIRRDIHRTFPEHPRFLLGQGQQELFNVLKAYSMLDIEVGYCQGMAFLAGILLMYMPEQLAFLLFAELMSAEGANLRRYYQDGLSALKHEMAKFDWILQRHYPRLAQHLTQKCVPCVLYVSQWFLTIFACPFPVDVTARLVDVMLTERSDRVIMQMAIAVMAELEAQLLDLHDFEDIITCLKLEATGWSDNKIRGLLSAAYLSSVSEEELELAGLSITEEAVGRLMSSPAGPQRSTEFTSDEVSAAEAAAGEAGAAERAASLAQGNASGLSAGSMALGAAAMDGGVFKQIMEAEIGTLRWAGPVSGEAERTASAPVSDPTSRRTALDAANPGADAVGATEAEDHRDGHVPAAPPGTENAQPADGSAAAEAEQPLQSVHTV